MNNNHSSRFFDGFLLGVIVGAIAVYLFGTKSGKNLVKIVSERGLDGLKDIIEEYNSTDLEEEFEEEEESVGDIKNDVKEKVEEVKTIAQEKVQDLVSNVSDEIKPPKKRFFKRIRR